MKEHSISDHTSTVVCIVNIFEESIIHYLKYDHRTVHKQVVIQN